MSSERPNIFLFVMDTARAENLSAYGYNRDTTPFLDNCAEDGFVFNNAIANSVWTYPSHVSMFTGLYPHEHQRISKHDRGKINFGSFVENLSDEGYKTIGLSNNGWVSPLFGFDSFFDDFKHLTNTKDRLFKESPLLDDFEEKNEEGYWDSKYKKYLDFSLEIVKKKSPKSLLNGGYYLFSRKILDNIIDDFWSDDGAEIALEELKNLDLGSKKPNFVFVNFIEPHTPYSPPRKFAENFYDGDIDEVRDVLDEDRTDVMGTEDSEKQDILIDFYDAGLKYMDHMLQKIKEEVESRSNRDNVFIYLGDHGEMFDEDGLWRHHGGFRESVVKVPLIIDGYKEGEEDALFELKDIGDLVMSISKNEELRIKRRKEAYSDYLGIMSHMLGDQDFSERFDRPQSARITREGLETATSLESAEGELLEHLRALKIKKNRNNLKED